jgi:hypothetical protein
MLPDRTTTMGEGESAMMERVFHIMKAEERTSAKLRVCWRNCRGLEVREENMVVVVDAGEGWMGGLRDRGEG